MNVLRACGWLAVLVLTTASLWGEEPDALNPFDEKRDALGRRMG